MLRRRLSLYTNAMKSTEHSDEGDGDTEDFDGRKRGLCRSVLSKSVKVKGDRVRVDFNDNENQASTTNI